jgi:formate C-acetyltransferase
MPGTFSYVSHAYLGEKTKATFDGRLAYTSFSDGCSAVQGRDTNGPTAMILSLTSWNQSKLLGGMVVNIKFNKNNLDGEKAQSFVTLLRTFVERGGIEMQVNVVDRKTLEDAMIHPENHENLLVRIGGYSDYFTRIKPSLQHEIIQRTQY